MLPPVPVAEPRKPEKGLKRSLVAEQVFLALTVAEPRKPEKGLKRLAGSAPGQAHAGSQNPENPRRD